MNNLPAGLDALIPGFPKLPTGGAGDKKAPFELVAGPFVSHELRVVSFHGRERVNDTYSYDVTFATNVPEELLYPAIDGEPASLTIKAPGHEPRIIQGIVSAFEPLGYLRARHGTKLLAYNVTIVPKLWLLRNQMRNRAFQERTPRQIVEEILAASNIHPNECRWRIRARDYRPLPFVLQRDESDYDFFCRILAEQGIFFYFEHASGLADQLLPGAGGIANAVGSVADLVGGPAADAIGAAGAASKMLTVLNFGDEPGHVPAVAAMAVANQAIGEGLHKAASMIGGDKAAALIDEEPCDTILVDDEKGGHVDDERIYAFGLRKEIRPKSVRLLEWDVQGSEAWESMAEMEPVVPSFVPKVGLSMGPDGPHVKANAKLGLEIDSPTIKSTQLGEDYYQLDTNFRAYANPKQRAERELQRRRRDYLVGRGESDCRRLGAGYRFRIGGHPASGLNIEYTVTELVSDGVHPDFTNDTSPVYRNKFECIPSSVAPRPPRPDKRPKLGLEIATVVDAGGAAVTPTLGTNHCAYVHVRFKWDIYDDPRLRDGLSFSPGADPDSHTVISVPVLQAWAGDGYGCQFIPREGMDVLIGFLGGHGERPVVLGCLYSERNLHPSQDPIKHQRVGIVTKTRPTDGNWSEVTLDDHRGHELIKMRAARDLDEEILHDRIATIGKDCTNVTGHDHATEVGRHVSLSAAGHYTIDVKENLSTTVGGSTHTVIVEDQTDLIQGTAERTVRGDLHETIGRDVHTTITGERVVSIGTTLAAAVGEHAELTVGTHGTDASALVQVWGNAHLFSAKRINLFAEDGLTIGVGPTTVEISPTGIRISASKIELSAHDTATVSAKQVNVSGSSSLDMKASNITLTSSGACLKMTSNADLSGASVRLNPPTNPSPEEMKAASPHPLVPFAIQLFDHDGDVYANNRYVLNLGVYRFEGATDGQGAITLQVPADAPDGTLTVWLSDYPTGPTRQYRISIKPMDPVSTLEGVQQRLRHLGYYHGAITTEMTPKLTKAIEAFQAKHTKEGPFITGALDQPTLDLIQRLHGY